MGQKNQITRRAAMIRLTKQVIIEVSAWDMRKILRNAYSKQFVKFINDDDVPENKRAYLLNKSPLDTAKHRSRGDCLFALIIFFK
jgi:hypothetical protein